MQTKLSVLLLVFASACSEPATPVVDAGLADAGHVEDAGLEPTCGPGERMALEGVCVKVGWRNCADGFAPDPSGWGCVEILPAGDCAPGTYPVLGETTCQPVGTRSCAEGFEPAASGLGCRPVLPSTSCVGATRDALGSTACVPLGDCDAPFPPAEATLFVDDSFSAEQLDASHFATIAEALAAASDGATIAVEEGRYLESLTIERPVKLVGRCAERVVLEGVLDGNRGLIVAGTAADAQVSGFSITSFDIGVLVKDGARFELRDSLLAANRYIGFLAQDEATATIRRGVVRGTLSNDSQKFGVGIAAIYGAQVVVEESAAVGNRMAGVFAQVEGSRLSMMRSVVRGTLPAEIGSDGASAIAIASSELDLSASAFEGGHLAGIEALQGARIALRDSVVTRTAMGSDTRGNRTSSGVVAQSSEVAIDNSTVDDCELHALYASMSAQVTATDSVFRGVRIPAEGELGIAVGAVTEAAVVLSGCAVVDNVGVGVITQGTGRIAMNDSLVAGTVPMETRTGTGLGLVSREGSQLTGNRIALVRNAVSGLTVEHPESSATIEDLVVLDTQAALLSDDASTRYGIGVRVVWGSLTLRRAVISGSAGAGLLIDDESASVVLEDVLIKDTDVLEFGTHGYGIAVQLGAKLTGSRIGVVGSRTAGIHTSDSGEISLSEIMVAGTRSDANGWYGHGVVIGGGDFSMTDSVVMDAEQVAFLAIHPNSRARLRDSLVRGQGMGADQPFGYGVFVIDSARADLAGTTVTDNASIGLYFSNATGTVSACRIERNTVALSVVQGSDLSEQQSVPDEVAEKQVVVTSDSVFKENATRFGTGVVPTPPVPEGI